MLNGSTINDAGYYVSESGEKNDKKGNPESDLKTVTHTSDGKKRKVTDTNNKILQQKILSNRTLPIVTTIMDPNIDNMIATCGGTPHTIATPTTKEVITDAACSSTRVNRIPGHVSRTDRDSTTPGNGDISIRSPQITIHF